MSNLLIVAPEFAGVDFKWIDTFKSTTPNGHTETVNVLAFNVQNKEGIKSMLEKELKRLQTLENPEEIDVHNMAYLESILREMEQTGFQHDAPEALLEAISKSARRTFRQNDVIYLSGLSAIQK